MTERLSSTSTLENELSITRLFHRVNSVLPNDQEIVSVRPESSATEALQLLVTHGFSQLPVTIGRQVLGLFSYRSFSKAVTELGRTARNRRMHPDDLLVEDCIEPPIYARVTDEFRALFDSIDKYDAVLVGDPNLLQGIVTAMDILRYLYGVASPFVLLGEIELSLRELIRQAVTEDQLAECAKTSLKHYKEEEVPTRLVDMTFNDYVQIVGDGRHWPLFRPVFNGDRLRTRAKLEQAGDLRNEIFHFRREVTVADYEALSDLRDWMLRKATAAEARAMESRV